MVADLITTEDHGTTFNLDLRCVVFQDLDPKQVAQWLRVVAETAKVVTRAAKCISPFVKRMPWRSMARGTAKAFKKLGQEIQQELTLPEPWPRTALALKFALTVGAYFVCGFCVLLVIADAGLLATIPISVIKTMAALALMLFMAGCAWVALVQAEKCRVRLVAASRVLW